MVNSKVKSDRDFQIVLMLMACIANPIFINTVVVFVRLYWFEQRFTKIVKDAQLARRTRTRSRTKSEAKEEIDPGRLEAGVNGRAITVLHHTTVPNGATARNTLDSAPGMTDKDKLHHLESSIAAPLATQEHAGDSSLESSTRDFQTSSSGHSGPLQEKSAANHVPEFDEKQARDTSSEDIRPSQGRDSDESSDESTSTPAENWLGRNPSLRKADPPSPIIKREITFAENVKPSGHRRQRSDVEHAPGRIGTEHHIAFLEKQRNNHTTGTLRIPGPRDFDRGDKPQELDDDEDIDPLQRSMTRNTLPSSPRSVRRTGSQDSIEMNIDDHPPKRGITIDEPEHPRREHTERRQSNTPAKTHRLNIVAPLLRLRSRNNEGETIFGRSVSALRSRTMSFTKSQERDLSDPMPYLSWQPTIGRNSQFVDLTEEQREELGGIEYRSLKTLAIILVSYFIGFHTLGIIVFTPWIVRSGTWGPIVNADGVSRGWWGVFTPASMFNDLGFTLTPDSMVSFQTAVMPLLFGSFLIIIGNTGFPCMLRFVIWALTKLVPKRSGISDELHFLLDHPRRCFTLMFPSRATWWLFWVLVLLNGVDLLFFIILDLNDPVVTVLAPGFRVLNGWFQAASTRTAGFACVNLAALHPAIQVSYLIMMYISVFPIAISVRRTNVYEEKSLGIWGDDGEEDEEGRSYVGQHLRRQLSFDLWYIFLGLFIIAIAEGGRIQDTNAYAFTMFAVLFEIVSAYGTVGLSLGYPNINASFSAEFGVIAKLVIIAMMIRGRHRGLPYALDRAILLPSENLHKQEDEDARRREALTTSLDGTADDDDDDDDDTQLPRQRTIDRRNSTRHGNDGLGPGSMRQGRRGSEVSTMSKRSTDPSARSKRRLSTVVMGALNAGPTMQNRKLD